MESSRRLCGGQYLQCSHSIINLMQLKILKCQSDFCFHLRFFQKGLEQAQMTCISSIRLYLGRVTQICLLPFRLPNINFENRSKHKEIISNLIVTLHHLTVTVASGPQTAHASFASSVIVPCLGLVDKFNFSSQFCQKSGDNGP